MVSNSVLKLAADLLKVSVVRLKMSTLWVAKFFVFFFSPQQ